MKYEPDMLLTGFERFIHWQYKHTQTHTQTLSGREPDAVERRERFLSRPALRLVFFIQCFIFCLLHPLKRKALMGL